MVVTRSGYDCNQESQVTERNRWVGCFKSLAAWVRDFISVTFLIGVRDSRLSCWNVSLVLSRTLLYALWLLLVTGLVQALRHEPEQQTGLARVIDALVGSAPSQTRQDFHELPESSKGRRSLSFELHQLDAAGLLSGLDAPTPGPAGSTSPSTPPGPAGSTSPATPPTPPGPAGSTSPTTPPTPGSPMPGPPPYRIFSWVTFASGIIGGIVSLLSAVAGLYGVALWLQCARAVRNAENEVRRRALQPGEGEELEAV